MRLPPRALPLGFGLLVALLLNSSLVLRLQWRAGAAEDTARGVAVQLQALERELGELREKHTVLSPGMAFPGLKLL